MDEPIAITAPERFARLRLIRSTNIGTVTFWALLERYGDAITAIEALPNLVRKAAKRPIKLFSVDEATREFDATDKAGARLLAHGETPPRSANASPARLHATSALPASSSHRDSREASTRPPTTAAYQPARSP